jgi:hypothetical protein
MKRTQRGQTLPASLCPVMSGFHSGAPLHFTQQMLPQF